jgi:hypothetical protein
MLGLSQPASRQERLEWWRLQIARQQAGHHSITEFCRQLGVTLSAYYYWKNRIQEVPRNAHLPVPVRNPVRCLATPMDTARADFVPVTIISPSGDTQLEIELTNDCVVRLRGAIDPALLQAAITATGQLNGSRRGAH